MYFIYLVPLGRQKVPILKVATLPGHILKITLRLKRNLKDETKAMKQSIRQVNRRRNKKTGSTVQATGKY